MRDFIFVADPHFDSYCNVRVDGKEICDVLIKKFEFILECANKWNAQLLIGGDLLNKPSVPLFVLNKISNLFKQFKYPVVTIRSNHDTLFDNPSFDYKTGVQLLADVGVVKYLKGDSFIIEDEGQKLKITNTRNNVDCGNPTIILYHGFLNKEDGSNTFMFNDIPSNDKCLVLLGHDHVEYETVDYSNAKIFRIGSLLRAIRAGEQMRYPKLLRIRLKSDNTFATKLYTVPSKDPSLIFSEKKAKAEEVIQDYSTLIEQIKQSSLKELSLIEACKMVTTPRVVDYLQSVYDDIRTTKANK